MVGGTFMMEKEKVKKKIIMQKSRRSVLDAQRDFHSESRLKVGTHSKRWGREELASGLIHIAGGN